MAKKPGRYQDMLSPRNDVVFKLLFGNEKNLHILAAFLQAVLDIPAEEYGHITLANPTLKINVKDDKTVILDVKLYTKSGMVINVEIQILPVLSFRERIVYYASKLVTEQLGDGENYGLIKKTISLVITDFTLFANTPEYLNRFTFRTAGGLEFSKIMEIYTLELPKMPEACDNTAAWAWMRFFKAETPEEYMRLKEDYPVVAEAVGELCRLSEDSDARYLADLREKGRRDQQAGIDYAMERGRAEGRQEGRQEGRAEGRQEGVLEIARAMKANNMPLAQISLFTGLSELQLKDI